MCDKCLFSKVQRLKLLSSIIRHSQPQCIKKVCLVIYMVEIPFGNGVLLLFRGSTAASQEVIPCQELGATFEEPSELSEKQNLFTVQQCCSLAPVHLFRTGNRVYICILPDLNRSRHWRSHFAVGCQEQHHPSFLLSQILLTARGCGTPFLNLALCSNSCF